MCACVRVCVCVRACVYVMYVCVSGGHFRVLTQSLCQQDRVWKTFLLSAPFQVPDPFWFSFLFSTPSLLSTIASQCHCFRNQTKKSHKPFRTVHHYDMKIARNIKGCPWILSEGSLSYPWCPKPLTSLPEPTTCLWMACIWRGPQANAWAKSIC